MGEKNINALVLHEIKKMSINENIAYSWFIKHMNDIDLITGEVENPDDLRKIINKFNSEGSYQAAIMAIYKLIKQMIRNGNI